MARLSRELRTPTVQDSQQFATAIAIEIAALRAAGVDPAAVVALEQRITTLAQLVDKFNREATAAKASGQYTVTGLFSRIDALTVAARAEVAKVVAGVTYHSRIDEIEQKIAATPVRPPRLTKETTAGGETILLGPPPSALQEQALRDELREAEVRRRLEHVDKMIIEGELLSAISVGNATVVVSILSDPLAESAQFSLISATARQECLRLWAEKNNPGLLEELQSQQRLNSVWNSALQMAESCFEAVGGSKAHDPIAEQAGIMPEVAA